MGVSREELYDQIWTEPITKVAKRHDVSDSYLVRILKRLNIPRPPTGYWAKLAAGKRLPKRPDLPSALPGDELEWSRDYMATERAPLKLPAPPETADTPISSSQNKKSGHHPLLKDTPQYFRNVRETDTGHLKPLKKNIPDVIVTTNTLERAFKILNELFLMLHKHGHRVMLATYKQHLRRQELKLDESGLDYFQYSGLWSPGEPTLVYIGTIAIGLTIFETTERIKLRRINGRDVPESSIKPESQTWNHSWDFSYQKDIATGRLCLKAYSPYPGTSWNKQWLETQEKSLKDMLNSISKELVKEAEKVASEANEAERKFEVQRKEWENKLAVCEKQRTEEKQQKALLESTEDLLSIIKTWSEMKAIESFFQDIQNKASQLPSTERDQITSRLEAAKSQLKGEDALKLFLAWKSAEERLNLENK